MNLNKINHVDISIWIEQVLDSCVTKEHLEVAGKLIENFERILLNYDYSLYLMHSKHLRDKARQMNCAINF